MNILAQNLKEMDSRIAGRVYQARKSSGVAIREISKSIGVSGQQLSKYERGENRIPVSRLLLLAEKLGKDLSYFYKDLKG